MFRLDKLSDREWFLYNIFFISVILSLSLSINPAALRLNYYFRISNIFLLPLVYNYFKIKFIPLVLIIAISVISLFTCFPQKDLTERETGILLLKRYLLKMIRLIKTAYHYLHNRYLIIKNPMLYARKIGVNMLGKVYLYGANIGMFGSEPWLVTLGDNVHITGRCQFITHDGAVLILRKKIKDLELTFPIVIGNNVFVGFDTKILPGVTIGDNVIIGAGSVVNKDIPSNTVAAGVPCKVIKALKDYEEYAVKNSLKYGHLSGVEKDDMLKKHYNYGKEANHSLFRRF